MSRATVNLTTSEVATLLGVSPRTLHRWHALRVGPPRCKIGRKVLYRKEALEAWLEANEDQPLRRFSKA